MSNWIKCSERLPSNKEMNYVRRGSWRRWEGVFLVLDEDRKHRFIQFFRVTGKNAKGKPYPGFWGVWAIGLKKFDNITHWMPLPEPPSE